MSDIEKEYLIAQWEVQLSKDDGFRNIVIEKDGSYTTNDHVGTWTYDGEILVLTSETQKISYTNLERKGGDYLLLDRTDIEGEEGGRTWLKQ